MKYLISQINWNIRCPSDIFYFFSYCKNGDNVVGIIKGDNRFTYLNKMIKNSILSDQIEDFYDIDILIIGFSGIDKNHYILGTGINLDKILENNNIKYIVTGMSNNELDKLAKMYCFNVIELMKDEGFVKDNAFLTAIGIINYLQKDDLNIASRSYLVLGYGNISFYLINLFKAYKVSYKIYPMNDFERKILSLNNEPITDTLYGTEDIIINTVPKNHSCDYNLLVGAKIIDVASYPYGFSSDKINEYNIDYKILSKIPSIYTPKSAAELVKKGINSIV